MVVIAHGVTAHKDRPWLMALADALSERRARVAARLVCRQRRVGGPLRGRRPIKGSGRPRQRARRARTSGVSSRSAYAGHSMGGAVGVLRAAIDPRIACLVSLAGMVHVRRVHAARTSAHLPPGAPMLDKPECPWSPALADDAARIGSVTAQAAARSACRGCWSTATPTSSCRTRMRSTRVRRPAAGRSWSTLPGVDHRFTGALPQVIDAVVPWLRDTCSAALQGRQAAVDPRRYVCRRARPRRRACDTLSTLLLSVRLRLPLRRDRPEPKRSRIRRCEFDPPRPSGPRDRPPRPSLASRVRSGLTGPSQENFRRPCAWPLAVAADAVWPVVQAEGQSCLHSSKGRGAHRPREARERRAGVWATLAKPPRLVARLHDRAGGPRHRHARGAHGHGDGHGVDLRSGRRLLGRASGRRRGGHGGPHRVDADDDLHAGDGAVDWRNRDCRAAHRRAGPRGRRQRGRAGHRARRRSCPRSSAWPARGMRRRCWR